MAKVAIYLSNLRFTDFVNIRIVLAGERIFDVYAEDL